MEILPDSRNYRSSEAGQTTRSPRKMAFLRIRFGKYILDFVLAQVRTAMGIVPVAMGRDVFDIEKLKPGMIIAMNADVKVDLSKPEDFKS